MFKTTNFIFYRFSDVFLFFLWNNHFYKMINVIIIMQTLHFKNNTGKNGIQSSWKRNKGFRKWQIRDPAGYCWVVISTMYRSLYTPTHSIIHLIWLQININYYSYNITCIFSFSHHHSIWQRFAVNHNSVCYLGVFGQKRAVSKTCSTQV